MLCRMDRLEKTRIRYSLLKVDKSKAATTLDLGIDSLGLNFLIPSLVEYA